jgi:DNA-binding response OmpR family regulator
VSGSERSASTSPLVVVVEDEPAIADLIELYLLRANYRVRKEGDGRVALDVIRQARPAAVILDVGLPGLDGVEVCKRLRAEQDWTPILFVTARDDEVDRVVGLELGADDYVTKPFSPRELVARVASVLRRADGPASDAVRPVEVGRVRLDVGGRHVFADEVEISLTATEFDLLAYLMKSPGRVFSRDQLMQAIWGYGDAAGTRTVDVHIAQLRAKLAGASPVRTVRGVGYAAESDGKQPGR